MTIMKFIIITNPYIKFLVTILQIFIYFLDRNPYCILCALAFGLLGIYELEPSIKTVKELKANKTKKNNHWED